MSDNVYFGGRGVYSPVFWDLLTVLIWDLCVRSLSSLHGLVVPCVHRSVGGSSGELQDYYPYPYLIETTWCVIREGLPSLAGKQHVHS